MGLQFASERERFGRAARFAHDRKTVVGVQQLHEAMAKKGMIIHHHDVNRLVQFRFRIINDTARKRVRRNRLGRELLRLAGRFPSTFPGVLPCFGLRSHSSEGEITLRG